MLVSDQRRVQQLSLQLGKLGFIQRGYKVGQQHARQQFGHPLGLMGGGLALLPRVEVAGEKIRPIRQQR